MGSKELFVVFGILTGVGWQVLVGHGLAVYDAPHIHPEVRFETACRDSGTISGGAAPQRLIVNVADSMWEMQD
jgi:hypothetical protein